MSVLPYFKVLSQFIILTIWAAMEQPLFMTSKPLHQLNIMTFKPSILLGVQDSTPNVLQGIDILILILFKITKFYSNTLHNKIMMDSKTLASTQPIQFSKPVSFVSRMEAINAMRTFLFMILLLKVAMQPQIAQFQQQILQFYPHLLNSVLYVMESIVLIVKSGIEIIVCNAMAHYIRQLLMDCVNAIPVTIVQVFFVSQTVRITCKDVN